MSVSTLLPRVPCETNSSEIGVCDTQRHHAHFFSIYCTWLLTKYTRNWIILAHTSCM